MRVAYMDISSSIVVGRLGEQKIDKIMCAGDPVINSKPYLLPVASTLNSNNYKLEN